MTDDADVTANPGYLLGQMARALTTAEHHDDPEARARAEKRVERFRLAFQGMISGALSVGSRTPVAGTPAWATLEVVTGGFATGRLLAEGPVEPHETSRAAAIGVAPEGPVRAALNAHYLSDSGLAELRAMLASGLYRVEIPEDAALLAVAWLVGAGQTDSARTVLEAIGPFLDRLRFYPAQSDRPAPSGAAVRVQDLGATRQDLQRIRPRADYQRLRQSIRVWAPLSDRLVALFLETLEGPIPTLETGPNGRPLRNTNGSFTIRGGWPCQHYPEGWHARAQALLAEIARALEGATDTKSLHGATNFARLRDALSRVVEDPASLSGREVGAIRLVLASIVTKRGAPGSERHRDARARQARQLARPSTHALSRVLLARLESRRADDGLDTLDDVLAPLTEAEAIPLEVRARARFPPTFTTKLARSWNAPVEALVEKRVVRSTEMLARLLPRITAQTVSAGFADSSLRRLYAVTYEAFRRRRSLLLLDLQHQVRFEELPWVSAIAANRGGGTTERDHARASLEQVVMLAVTCFPHVILPNKLLQEIRALSERAGLALPIVDEVAADIFMGTFTEKFLRAAQRATTLLEGKLYPLYYGIDCRAIRVLDVSASRFGPPTSAGFADLCRARAGVASGGRSSVAANGAVIEQSQVLTTHNLAVLVDALGLVESLRGRFPELSRSTFQWICREQSKRIPHWRARLQNVKNSAYAWRQMVFYLSFASPSELEDFLVWARGHVETHKQKRALEPKLGPALRGLAIAVAGGSLDSGSAAVRDGEARRFFGWAAGPERHWLLGEK